MAKPSLIYMPRLQYFDNLGVPLSGGKVFIYQAGTTTKMNTYTDTSLSTINPNPVILDVAGRPANSGAPIDMYTTAAYTMVVAPSTDTDPPMSPIWTENNITTLGQTLQVKTIATSYTVGQLDRDFLLLVDCSAGPVTITLLPTATAGNGFNIKIKKTDSSNNTLTIQANAAETIDGHNTVTTTIQYEFVSLDCSGTAWFEENSPVPVVPFQNMRVFNASGSFTAPVGITTVQVEAYGAGGGGGGSTSTTVNGAGGGGGAYVLGMTSVTPGTTTTITIGAGGAGAALNTTATGSSGTATSFGSQVIAAGGTGGATNVGGAGGTPGASTVPTNGLVLAGNSGDSSATTIPLGNGGAAPMMGIRPPLVGLSGSNGPPNTGSGGMGGSQTLAGGTGASGLMILRY